MIRKILLLAILALPMFSKAQCEVSFINNTDTANMYMIRFYDFSSFTATSWLWSFGDGNIDSVKNPTHTYTSGGAYNVCLTATDTVSGCSNTFCQQVVVGVTGCSSNFNFMNDLVNPHTEIFTDVSFGNPTGWLWVFGDGDSAFVQNPIHTYATGGFYNVCLTIFDSVTNCTDTYCESAEVKDCYADLDYNADSVNVLMVSFTDLSVSAIGSVTGWLWEFGDGDTSHVKNPVHTYAVAGGYPVCLTISDSVTGCTNEYCTYAYFGPPTTCSESWDYKVDSLDINKIKFLDFHWGSEPTKWQWSFGDGDSSTVKNPIHTYAIPGVYQVCLTITDSTLDCNATDCYMLAVGDQTTCHAHFADTLVTANIVKFTSSYTGSTPSVYYWDFGTSGTSSLQNPTIDFGAPGKYLVCLTITDSAANCQNTYCDSVTIISTQGVQNYKLENSFVVYPNPTKGVLNILNLSQTNSESTLKIYNQVGELVEQHSMRNSSEVVDLTGKPAGYYMISVESETGIARKKVMIVK